MLKVRAILYPIYQRNTSEHDLLQSCWDAEARVIKWGPGKWQVCFSVSFIPDESFKTRGGNGLSNQQTLLVLRLEFYQETLTSKPYWISIILTADFTLSHNPAIIDANQYGGIPQPLNNMPQSLQSESGLYTISYLTQLLQLIRDNVSPCNLLVYKRIATDTIVKV